jgi:hypothetical protein
LVLLKKEKKKEKVNKKPHFVNCRGGPDAVIFNHFNKISQLFAIKISLSNYSSKKADDLFDPISGSGVVKLCLFSFQSIVQPNYTSLPLQS